MSEITEDEIYCAVTQAWKNPGDETARVIATLYAQRNDAMGRIAELEAELKTFREVEMRETEAYQKRIAELEAACKLTIEENLHLADGEDCTLIHLNRVMESAESAGGE
jgi:hypothetical protein